MNAIAENQAVVLFSTAEWFWPYWTNKQHIATRLASRGFRVLYVESMGFRRPGFNSSDFGRVWRRIKYGVGPIREVQKNLWVLPPLTIPRLHHWPWADHVNTWQLRTGIASWLRGIDSDRPIVWTYHPYMLRLATALNPTALIYHCVDNIGAMPGVDGMAFDRAERKLLAAADRIFTTSPALQHRCAMIAPGRTDYFGNVADIEYFATARLDGAVPADLAAIPRPRLAYVGVLSDFKIDLQLVEYVVEQRPHWHLVFIGDEREGQNSVTIARLKSRANVHFLGWKPYAQLPAYLHGIDVALLPQMINDYTRSMFPMKYFEYLAAGRPVVATRLPALAEFTALHREADTPENFINAIASALVTPAAVPVDHPVLQFHSWDALLDRMLDRIAMAQESPGLAHNRSIAVKLI
jgi:glycosyltransferase involved in cell wall biosynthesis